MKNWFRLSQRIAICSLLFSSTTAWAQMPSQTLSPLNQLFRAWGFGVSDGYHECVTCPKVTDRPHDLFVLPNSNLFYRAPEHKNQSMISRAMAAKPVATSIASLKTHTQSDVQAEQPRANDAMPMTILPPSTQMYQQFAEPHSTPLPNSSYAPTETSLGQTPENIYRQPTWSQNATIPIADPRVNATNDQYLFQNNGNEAQSFSSDAVPPPPPFRQRQKGDKPLGEEPMRLNPDASPSDQLPSNASDDFDLLPVSGESPITTFQKRPSSTPIVENQSTQSVGSQYRSGSRSMLQDYYGNVYSQISAPINIDASRSTTNRYR
ncbi:MAG: hypothetical protein SGI77_19310 [Pirellulaceae bacterium]|nr:hypothetical protein [Pirellulaceae bacterium]